MEPRWLNFSSTSLAKSAQEAEHTTSLQIRRRLFSCHHSFLRKVFVNKIKFNSSIPNVHQVIKSSSHRSNLIIFTCDLGVLFSHFFLYDYFVNRFVLHSQFFIFNSVCHVDLMTGEFRDLFENELRSLQFWIHSRMKRSIWKVVPSIYKHALAHPP